MDQAERHPRGAPRPVIDVHTHFVPPSAVAAAQAGGCWHGIRFGRSARGKLASSIGGPMRELPWPEPLEDATTRLASMAARGVDVEVVSISPTLYWHGLDGERAVALARQANDELATFTAAHPDHYAGLGYLPLQDPPASVAELERCVRDLGLPGVMVATHVNGEDWDSEALFPVLEAAEALGAVVYVHPAQGRADGFLMRYHLRNLLGNPFETTIALACMIFGGVFDRLPRLKACFAHGGGYGVLGIGRMDHGAAARPEAAGVAALPSDYVRACWFDCITHGERALRHLIDVVGAERILLGSDHPADMGQPQPVRFIQSCGSLSARERAAILSDNAAALLQWQGATKGRAA